MTESRNKRSVIIVNDNPVQLNLMAKLLSKDGIKAIRFADVEAALTAMNPACPPDLIVTDLYMPGIDGWRFCRLLRSAEFEAFKAVPILVVSATFAGEHPERIAKEIGADAFLSFPLNGREFVAQARALMQGNVLHPLPRVLIVEATQALAGLLHNSFTKNGYHADTAFSVHEAQEYLTETPCDVAVLEYKLPDGNGDTLLDSFRIQRPDCVCLMITSDPTPELALDWMKRGASAYLRKPFEPESLIELCARTRRERTFLSAGDQLEARMHERRETDKQYRIFFDSFSDAVFVYELFENTQPGRFLEVNEAACQLLGYARHELLDMTQRDIIDRSEYERHSYWRGQPGDLGKIFIETIAVAKDGRKITVECAIRRITYLGKTAILFVSRDITERKQMELSIQRRDVLLDATVRASTLLLTSTTPHDALNGIVRLLGKASGQDRAYFYSWQGDPTTAHIKISLDHEWVREGIQPQKQNPVFRELPLDQVAPYSCERLRRGLEVCASMKELPMDEWHVLKPLGVLSLLMIPIMVNGVTKGVLGFDNSRMEYAWAAGERSALAVVAVNLGAAFARSQVDVALRESEMRFHGLLRNVATVAVQGYSMDGTVRYWNHASETFYGYTAEEVLGRNLLDLIIPPDMRAGVSEAMQYMARTGEVIPAAELRMMHKDGSLVPVYSSHALVHVPGQETELFCIDTNLSEVKRAEAKLRQLAQAVESSPAAIIITDNKGSIVYVNHAFESITGYTDVDAIGKNPRFLQSVNMTPEDYRELWTAISSGKEWRGEFHNRRKNGSLYWESASIAPVFDTSGIITHYLAIKEDITERKHAEEELARSESKFRNYFELPLVGIAVTSPEKKWNDANSKLCDLLGYKPEELFKLTWADLTPADDLQIEYAEYNRILRGEKTSRTFEKRFIRKDGSILDVIVSSICVRKPDGSPDYFLSAVQDITERKRVEEVLRSTMQTAADIVNKIPSGFFIYQFVEPDELYLLEANPEAERLAGIHLDETRNREFNDIWSDAKHKGIKDQYLLVVHTGQLFETEDLVYQDSRLTGAFRIRAFLLPGSKLAVAYENVTDSKLAENELRKSESQLAAALKIAKLGHWELDVKSSKFILTDSFYALYKTTAQQTGGYLMSIKDYVKRFVHPDDIKMVMEATQRAMETDDASFTQYLEHRILHSDGSIGYIGVRFYISKDNEGKTIRIYGANQDITERKLAELEREKLDAQLAQSQKMESVGRLAGGVAHDFNNMLGVILGHVELMMNRFQGDDLLYSELKEIQSAAQRSASLTRQLLAFARKQTVEPRVIDLNETVDGMLKMLRRLIGEDIDLVWLPGKNIAPIKIDPSQIDQVMANLCVNARDAISGVGKVTIKTKNAILDEHYCSQHKGCIPGEYVLLAVSDDGCGIEAESLSRIFEPFFTTKEMGKGTGLGLATVYGVVKQNNGYINVRSEPHRETTFEIYLPSHAVEIKPRSEPTKTTIHGNEMILIVEDEPAIVKMITMMLEGYGYAVMSAGSPGDAIRLAHSHTGTIDLLLTDVVMPEMSGRDLSEILLASYPNLKRLFMSGYTADFIARQGVLDAGVQFLQKPFSMTELGAKIRETMEKG